MIALTFQRTDQDELVKELEDGCDMVESKEYGKIVLGVVGKGEGYFACGQSGFFSKNDGDMVLGEIKKTKGQFVFVNPNALAQDPRFKDLIESELRRISTTMRNPKGD